MRHVFDANCWCLYVDEKLASKSDIGTKMFESASAEVAYLFDAAKMMQQQYISMRRPYAEELFNIWFEDNVMRRSVDVIDLKGTKNLYRDLISLGVPKKEHIYFRVAAVGNATLLVSLDSDFFDPSKKVSGAKEKFKILREASGPVCRYMKKHKVEICCPEAFA